MEFKFSLHFTIQDAVNLFRDSGLVVEQQNKNFEFVSNDKPYTEDLFVWVVQNPNTKEYMLLKDAFQKYLDISIKSLVLDHVSKLDIFKIFEKCPDLKKK